MMPNCCIGRATECRLHSHTCLCQCESFDSCRRHIHNLQYMLHKGGEEKKVSTQQIWLEPKDDKSSIFAHIQSFFLITCLSFSSVAVSYRIAHEKQVVIGDQVSVEKRFILCIGLSSCIPCYPTCTNLIDNSSFVLFPVQLHFLTDQWQFLKPARLLSQTVASSC